MASNFYEQRIAGSGVFLGRTLLQASGEIGGLRHVFVKWQGQGKDALVYPTVGGKVVNPFKGNAKIFAGDLVEYNPGITGDAGATVKILKTYKVNSVSGTTVNIVRDGYKHIPFVGDILMKAPDEIGGTGTAATVTAVSKTTDGGVDVWAVTVSAALTLTANDILVEGLADGETTPMVTNPNAYAQCDYDFVYNPAADDDDFEGAKYLLTPCIANEDTKLYINKMSPLPASILALNRSKVEGWFNL